MRRAERIPFYRPSEPSTAAEIRAAIISLTREARKCSGEPKRRIDARIAELENKLAALKEQETRP